MIIRKDINQHKYKLSRSKRKQQDFEEGFII